MPQHPIIPIEKADIATSFSEAAHTYEDAAVLQLEVGRRLEERLDFIKLNPKHIIDIGASTGRFSQQLKQRYQAASIFSLDIAYNMLKVGRDHFSNRNQAICADAEFLPFADNSVELIFSNLTVQWLPTTDFFAKECFRVLKPGGLLFFTTLGPDTLFELKSAWSAVDTDVHVNTFLDMHDVGDSLHKTGFSDPVMDSEVITVTYRALKRLILDLKQTGTHNLNTHRPQGLTGKDKLKAMYAAYEQFKNSDDVYPASYEVIYGHAWKPDAAQLTKKKQNPTEFRIAVEDIKKYER